MISKEYRSQENGKMMKKSEGQSFTEKGKNMRVKYLKICLMAREFILLQLEVSTRETFKMA
jgi:hypothetical protein